MAGLLEQIYYAPEHGAPQEPISAGRLVLAKGLEGDRHFGQGGGALSLIEAEAIEQFNADSGLTIPPAAMRRNLLTRGIRLNPLVGQTFSIGEVRVEGFELCEPCASLGNSLATEDHDAASIVQAFLRSAGLRVWVRSTGVVRAGDEIA